MSDPRDLPVNTSPAYYIPISFHRHWSETLDAFDEESCRYFLNEVGKRIVPCFPFAFGIEEVHGMIVERYGLEGAADVISILQELLEDDQNACGFGDDGDIWRSWRHSWRHRNDNAAHPFIARFRDLILQPPTSTHLRRQKAEKFLRLQQFERVAPNQDMHQESRCSDRVEDGQREFNAILSSRQEDTLTDKTEATRRTDCHATSRLLRTPAPVVSFTSLSQFPVPPSRSDHTPCASQYVEHSPRHVRDGLTSGLKAQYRLLEHEHMTEPSVAAEKPGSHEHVLSHPVTPATCCYDENHIAQQASRLENRQARLIDGEIFTFKSKRPRQSTTHVSGRKDDLHNKSASLEDHKLCIPVKHTLQYRKSWIRGLRNFFHRISVEVSSGDSRHKSTQSNALTHLGTFGTMPSSTTARQEHLAPSVNANATFGLDGSSDDSARAHAPVANLNKPLPVNPEGPAQTYQDRFYGNFPTSEPLRDHQPSSASTTSSKLSTKSSKADFHEITRDLLHMNMGHGQHLHPIKELDTNLNSSLGNAVNEPTTPKSWTSISARDSMPDYLAYYSPAMPPPPLDLKRTHLPSSDVLAKSIPYSHSAPALEQQQQMKQSVLKGFLPVHPEMYKHTFEQSEGGVGGLELRGRSPNKPKSGKIEGGPETPTKSRKHERSRSPMKRLFGFSKSDSSNTSQDDCPQPSNTPTSKKSSIKKWGDRIRYGFLTPDEEQLCNEQLIEDHMNTDSPPVNSTFPVSLEPPTQAKLQSEIELYVTVTANRFLMKEAKAGRLSGHSVTKVKEEWNKLGRPQVVEFHYDQTYQRNLVYANIQNVKFYGDAAKDQTQVRSTLAGWQVMAREMSVRTFCSPDSVLRKHLHDAHRVLELLGAPFVTFLAYENMQIKSLQMISQRQKERREAKRANGHARSFSDGARVPSSNTTLYEPEYTAESFQLDKIRLSPSPTPPFRIRQEPRKATGAEGAIMSLPLPPARMRVRPADRVQDHFDQSKGGRLGKVIHEKPENLLL